MGGVLETFMDVVFSISKELHPEVWCSLESSETEVMENSLGVLWRNSEYHMQ